MAKTLHHIEIYVNDIEVSKAFWGWFLGELGYSLYQSFHKGVSFRLEDTYLVFVEVKAKYRQKGYNRCQIGLNHLAFHGESKEFIDLMTKSLQERGIHILYEDKHPHAGGKDSYGVFFEDPDRIKVEITLDE